MFKKDYSCFIAGLPEIFQDECKLSLSVDEFREQAKDYIAGRDKDLLNLFFLPDDNRQVLRLLSKIEPDMSLRTVYSLKQLEEEIEEPLLLPCYLQQFIHDYKEGHLRYNTTPENVLSWMYYDGMRYSHNDFVRRYAGFVMNLKNLITALNSRKYGRDITKEVIGNDEFAEALRTVAARDFGLSIDYPFVEDVIALMQNGNLAEREKELDMLIWDFLDEAIIFEYFSIEKVIGFVLKLMILERWCNMTTESGRAAFMKAVERMRGSLDFKYVAGDKN